MLDAEQALIMTFDNKQLYNFDVTRSGNPRSYGPGKSGPWTEAQRAAKSVAMKGIAPINKGVTMSDATKAKWLVGSQHRYFPVGIFDEMGNMVAWYSSFTETVLKERGGRSTLHQCIKQNKPWKGWHVRYVERHSKQ
jgi:hypothetical protein